MTPKRIKDTNNQDIPNTQNAGKRIDNCPFIMKEKDGQNKIKFLNNNKVRINLHNEDNKAIHFIGNLVERKKLKNNFLKRNVGTELSNQNNNQRMGKFKFVGFPLNKQKSKSPSINIFNKLISKGNIKKSNSPENAVKNLLVENNESKIKDCYYILEPNKACCDDKMEDFVSVHHPLKGLSVNSSSLFCVFDGHNGTQVAQFLQENFHKYLIKNLKDYSLEKNLHNILSTTFEEIDKEIEKLPKSDDVGSTATVVFVDDNYVYCANVGDSKCFFINDKGAYPLSKDHTCKIQKEVDRIRAKGGKIFNGRVFGSLVLTRAFGDFGLKEFGVIALPSISTVDTTKTKVKYVVLASDGLWDVVEEEEVYKLTQERDWTAKELCQKLIDLSIERFSRDNICCVVVKFRGE